MSFSFPLSRLLYSYSLFFLLLFFLIASAAASQGTRGDFKKGFLNISASSNGGRVYTKDTTSVHLRHGHGSEWRPSTGCFFGFFFFRSDRVTVVKT